MVDYFFKKDITFVCKKAVSFPSGVQEAFEILHENIPFSLDRNFFSFSWMNATKEIVYLAGAEIFEGESFPELETFNFKKGKYRGNIISDFMKDIPKIGTLFQELCKDSDLDSNGYSVECYFNEKDVKCFVKMNK